MTTNSDQEAKIAFLTQLLRADPTEARLSELCEENPSLHPDLEFQLRAELRVVLAFQRIERKQLANEPHERQNSLRRLGQYTLERKLGAGGFASVYLARRGEEQAAFAVKILAGRWRTNAEAIARFKKEANLRNIVLHPDIVPVLEYGVHRNRPYLVMPFIDGHDLQQLGLKERIDVDRAARYIRRAALACSAIHQKGIIHRDIKPANLLIKGDDVFLSDFGLARMPDSDHLTRGSESLGTLGYRAPEQIVTSFGEVGRPADVYALGATLFYLLNGTAPFAEIPAASKAEATLQIVTRGAFGPVSNSTMPQPLRRICNACLETFPEDRYQSVGELAEDLRRFLAHEPVRGNPVSLHKRLWNLRRLHPRSSVISLVICIIATALVVWFGSSARKSSAEADRVSRAQLAEQYVANMRSAQTFLERQRYGDAKELLARYGRPEDLHLRGFEWGYLSRLASFLPAVQLTDGDRQWIRPAFNMRGDRLALLDSHGIATVFDADAWNVRFRTSTRSIDVCFGWNDRLMALQLDSPTGGVEVSRAEDGTKLFRFAEGSQATAIAFDPIEPVIYVGDRGGQVKVWRLDLANQSAAVSASLAPELQQSDDQLRAAGDYPVSGMFLPIRSPVTSVSCLGDGRVFVGFENGRARIWNVSYVEGVCRVTLDKQRHAVSDQILHTGPVTGIAVHPRRPLHATQSAGDYVALDSRPGELKIWGDHAIIPTRAYAPHAETLLLPHDEDRSEWRRVLKGRLAPVFTSDGLLYTTSDNGVAVWDANTRGAPLLTLGGRTPVIGLAVGDARLVAVDSMKRATMFDIRERHDGQVIWRPSEVHMTIVGMALHRDRSLMAVAMRASMGELTLNLPQTPPASAPVIIYVDDLASGKRLLHAVESSDKVFADPPRTLAPAMAFDRNGGLVFAGHNVLIDGPESEEIRILPRQDFDEAQNDDGRISARVSFGARHAEVATISPETTKIIRTQPHEREISCVLTTSTGKETITGGLDGTIRVWSSVTGAQLAVERHSASVLAAAISDDDEVVAVGLDDGCIDLWSLRHRSRLASLRGHRGAVTSLAFIPNSSRLVSCSGVGLTASYEPGQVLLWDLSTNQLCLELNSQRPNVYSAVRVGDGGNAIYAAANAAGTLGEGQVLVWRAFVSD